MKKILFLSAIACSLASCDILLDDSNSDNPYNNNNNNTNNNTTTTTLNFLPTQVKGKDIIKYKYFTVSYSPAHKNPEWVAYELTAAERDASDLPRSGGFKKDPNYDKACSNDDYTGAGYDRGHLVPAEDMSFDETAMANSFYTTNVSPQDPAFNRGIWKSLEDKVRKWASSNKRVYIVAGPILPAKVTSNTPKIGNGVVIPKKFFKVVLDYEKAGGKKGIGFIFNNEAGDRPLKEMAISIDAVEEATGLDFFPDLSAAEQETLESKVDVDAWEW